MSKMAGRLSAITVQQPVCAATSYSGSRLTCPARNAFGRAASKNSPSVGFRFSGFSGHRLIGKAIVGCEPTLINFRSSVRVTASSTGGNVAVDKAAILDHYLHLQNGSDVRGVALEGIAGQNVNLTADASYHIARGFVAWLSDVLGKPASQLRVSIGNDPRLSGPALKAAAMDGIASMGASVTDFGLCTTPAMFMSCITEGFDFDGAVMLTASHLPFNRNGLKFFNKAGGTNKKDVKQILTTAASSAAEGRPMAKGSPAQYKQAEFLPTYARILQDVIRKGINHPTDYEHPLKGLKLLVDAGNGAGGFFATLVLAPLGADTSGSQFLEPDGTFPNHIPNPEDAKAMEMTVAAVLKSKADLGIVFDTDVDRSGVVDAEGNAINRNRLIAILADIVLREHPGSTIVTDSVTSNGLAKLIEARGGRHFRFTKGYKNIIDKGIALNETGVETHLMIETSGHGAMKENYFLDDGAYLAVKIVIEMVRKRLAGKGGIGDVLADLAEPVEEREFRLNLLPADFKAPGKAICDAFRETVVAGKIPGWKPEAENYEGTRVRVDEGGGKEGWILLRQSLHDPLLPMNVETEVKGGISRIVQDLDKYFLKGNPLVEGILDVSSLKPYM